MTAEILPMPMPSASPAVTYYDRPVIKEPVWIWSVPCYFFVGGVAGAAMVMGVVSALFGGDRLRPFEEKCRWVGAIGGGLGTALLIHDLGRPERFLAMLRVFRPTSPMSVGSWVLALATPLTAGSALLSRARGALGFVGVAAGAGGGVLGMPLATYTAVLVANSTVPVWLATRRTLPLLFGASAGSGFASVMELLPLAETERAIMHRFGIAARIADTLASHAVEREADADPRVGKVLHEGVAGALWKAAKVLTVTSLVLAAIPGRSVRRRRAAGVLGVLGGFALRFSVFYAGKASALDPHATFAQQRE